MILGQWNLKWHMLDVMHPEVLHFFRKVAFHFLQYYNCGWARFSFALLC